MGGRGLMKQAPSVNFAKAQTKMSKIQTLTKLSYKLYFHMPELPIKRYKKPVGNIIALSNGFLNSVPSSML